MSYKAMAEEAAKGGREKELTATYREWKKAGDSLIGRLIATNEVNSSLGTGTYKQYLFETDEGLVKCAFGSATDGEAGALMKRGGVYKVEYKGTEKITGGRKINRFSVTAIWEEGEAPVGGDFDIPF